MTLLRTAVAAAALLLAAPFALAAEFNDAQKAEIGTLVKDYLLQNPQVIEQALEELKRRDETAELKAAEQAIADNASAIFRNSGDLVAGNPDGKVTMVEFFDYNCGYCKRAMPDVVKMIAADTDLRIVMKELPILGPGSVYASKAALASRNQGKYWDFHLALLKHEGRIDEAATLAIAGELGLDVARLQKDMESPEVAESISQSQQLAQAMNIQGTPAFIIDRTLIPGAIGYEGLAAAVQAVRDGGGCKVC